MSEPVPNRIAFKVKPAAERSIRQGHPWIFENSIIRQPETGHPGDLAIIFDQKKNKLLAVGLYDPDSPVRIKLISFGKPANLGMDWFREKLDAAYQKRQPLLTTDTNSYRLVHGENDGLPGLIADVYADVLVLKLYSTIWLPYLGDLLPVLQSVSNCPTLVLRLSRQLQRNPKIPPGIQDGLVLAGTLPESEIVFREYGLLFRADVIQGHKTGFFLDHRHNRKRVGELAAGKRVLDVFSYAGGFSVHALAGGAREVISMDISAHALEMARKNVALNFSDSRHAVLAVDAFEGMAQLIREGELFELVIVDPPSFAKSESETEKALHAYARLSRLASRLVRPGGLLMLASCSSRVSSDAFFATVEKEILEINASSVLLETSFHDVDHPIGFPEGRYLKAGIWEF